MPRYRRYHELLQDEFAELGRCVGVLPLGAMENHGPHLPVGTDTIIAEAVIDRCVVQEEAEGGGATEFCALRLPALWLGASGEHAERPGTLSATPEMVVSNILALAPGLVREGIDRLVVLNAHGGNSAAAEIAALEARTKFGMLCAVPHWLDFGMPEGLDAPTSPQIDVHGGWMETSMMMAIAPERVGTVETSSSPRAPAPLLFPDGPVSWGWTSNDLGSSGILGRADLASVELGNTLLDHAASGLGNLIRQVADADWPIAR